jgi:hypothetical protein
MLNTRLVNVIHGKKAKRFVVTCPTCPINPSNFGGNQKTACLYILVKSKKAHRASHRMKKEQECVSYVVGSIKREPNGIASIVCSHE